MESKDERKTALEAWILAQSAVSHHRIQPMANDASLRRYFRVYTDQQTFVAMDAPPPENCEAFVAIGKKLRALGLMTPDILAADLKQGFLLLSDLGETTYLKGLTPHNADTLYRRALHELSVLQACRDVPGRDLPVFANAWMEQEWAWHQEWFLDKWLGLSLPPDNPVHHCYQQIVEQAVQQPYVFMHRDFHSANLMVMPEQTGLLDFQDAFMGPVTYDLVSLLRDCYIDWPEAQVKEWVEVYRQLLEAQGVLKSVDHATFMRWFDWMGLQRHLKALMTFARKHVRDHQSNYLQHVPRTLNYVCEVSGRYTELQPLHDYYMKQVAPCVR